MPVRTWQTPEMGRQRRRLKGKDCISGLSPSRHVSAKPERTQCQTPLTPELGSMAFSPNMATTRVGASMYGAAPSFLSGPGPTMPSGRGCPARDRTAVRVARRAFRVCCACYWKIKETCSPPPRSQELEIRRMETLVVLHTSPSAISPATPALLLARSGQLHRARCTSTILLRDKVSVSPICQTTYPACDPPLWCAQRDRREQSRLSEDGHLRLLARPCAGQWSALAHTKQQ